MSRCDFTKTSDCLVKRPPSSLSILILTPHCESVTIQPLFPSQSFITQRKDITMKNSKNIPISVQSLIGKKLNKIHVLKFNEKKSKPGKPVVDCKCLACGKPFSVNAYHVKYQTAKSCGCVRIGKENPKTEKKGKNTAKSSVKR
jgi:hypothetical protein